MKKALILHGWEGTSQSHWLPWLGKELEGEGYEVIIPDLPNTDYPVIEDQLEYLKLFPPLKRGARGDTGNETRNNAPLSSEGEGLGVRLQKGDIIIGHSLGCQLGLKYLEEEKLRGLKVLFVAPSYNYLADELGEDRLQDAFTCMSNYYNVDNNFRQINKLENSYTVMLSDDDPYINSFNAKEFYGQLDSINFVDFTGRGHFNTDAGVKELPEALKYL